MFTTWGLLGLALLGAAPEQERASLVVEAREAPIRTEGGPSQDGWNLWSNGRVGQRVALAGGGTYEVVIRARGTPAAGAWPEMGLVVDEVLVGSALVETNAYRDFRFRVDLKEGDHEVASSFLNDAKTDTEDRNLFLQRLTIIAPAGMAAPRALAGKAPPEEAARREAVVVAATGPAIDRHRKAPAVIQVVDGQGRPMPATRVRVVQKSHEFLFGCNIYGFDRGRSPEEVAAYKERFAGLFNYATLGFYWRSYEPRRGEPRYEATDKVVAWCQERGIRMKGHPILWGNRSGVPTWSQGQPAPDLQRQRVFDILGRYQGRIGFHEVVNEPSHELDVPIDGPYRWAREADPKAYLIINDYQVLGDGAPAFFRLLQKANADGVPYEGIGIQAHEPRMTRFPLERVQAVLDRYATLGKELHITEFTPTSAGQNVLGSHVEGVWDEAAQADYATKFYRVAFAHPAVRAITWWDLSDQFSWLPGGGLLRADMSPKPAYQALRDLIHKEWKTQAEGQTDASGRFEFRGFLGGYEVRVGDQDEAKTFTLRRDASPILVRPE